jgi:hypothetical protein
MSTEMKWSRIDSGREAKEWNRLLTMPAGWSIPEDIRLVYVTNDGGVDL